MKDKQAHIKIVKSVSGISVLTEWGTTMKNFVSHEEAVGFALSNDPDDWGRVWDAISGKYLSKGRTGINNVDMWDGEKFYKYHAA